MAVCAIVLTDGRRGHVKEIFDDVVSQIRSLVNAQISAIERKEGRLPKVCMPLLYPAGDI